MALNMLEELRVTLSDEEDYLRTRAAVSCPVTSDLTLTCDL